MLSNHKKVPNLFYLIIEMINFLEGFVFAVEECIRISSHNLEVVDFHLSFLYNKYSFLLFNELKNLN